MTDVDEMVAAMVEAANRNQPEGMTTGGLVMALGVAVIRVAGVCQDFGHANPQGFLPYWHPVAQGSTPTEQEAALASAILRDFVVWCGRNHKDPEWVEAERRLMAGVVEPYWNGAAFPDGKGLRMGILEGMGL